MILRVSLSTCLLAYLAVAEPLTPESASLLALTHNPRLVAARAVIEEAEARASGFGRLPSPELETEIAAGDHAGGRIEVGLSQAFPRTTRLRLERRVAKETLALARREVAVAEAETVTRVHYALINLVATTADLELVERHAVRLDAQAAAHRQLAETGQLAKLEATQADLIAREQTLVVHQARSIQFAAKASLAAELGLSPKALPATSYDLALPASPTQDLHLARRADLALSEASLAAGESELALARASGSEPWKLGVYIEGERSRDDFGAAENEALLGLRFSLPLPFRDVAAAAITEKQAARRRLLLERDALTATARTELELALAEVASRYHTARVIGRELLPAARAHHSATEAAQARGEAPSTQVFQSAERVAALERSELSARHAYHLAHVRALATAGLLHTAQP